MEQAIEGFEPANTEEELDPVAEAFKADGYLAQHHPAYSPRTGQVELAYAVLDAMEDSHNVIAEAPTGCHVAGQGILMFDGSIKKVEDIKIGDNLMGPDSNPRRVLLLARGSQDTVTIKPVKGEPWRVNIDHILSLVHTTTGEIVDVTAREHLGWSNNKKHLHKLFKPAHITFKQTPEVPISPYHLGMILGDGYIGGDTVSVCKAEPEIEKACHELALDFGLKVRVVDDGPTRKTFHICRQERFGGRSPNKLIRALKALGLMGSKAGTKFIPQRYKAGHTFVRESILAGLLDTDGHLSTGCYDYISKSKQLAEDVTFIARSLGLAAYCKPSKKTWQNGTGIYWRVSISGDLAILPLRIPRKQAPGRNQIKSVLRTGFTIIPSGRHENYYGFSLSGDGRYLLDDFTVTHNTGKSLGYGVPATWKASKGEKVVIVTANIALQEQLFTKDLPTLKEAMPWDFTFAIAKGLNNYLCLANFDETANDVVLSGIEGTHEEQEQWAQIVRWRAKTNIGDISELPFVPQPRLLPMFTTTSDDCPGKKCPKHDNCFAVRARAKARSSQVVVTNYHLFFADMALKLGGSTGVLPRYKHAVLDEGHKTAGIARDFMGYKMSKFGIANAVRLLDHPQGPESKKGYLPSIDKQLKNHTNSLSERLFDTLAVHYKSRAYTVRFRRHWEGPMFDQAKDLAHALKICAQQYLGSANDPALNEVRKHELTTMAMRCSGYSGNLVNASEHAGEGWIHYLEEGSKGTVALKGSPVSVAEYLRHSLFENKEGDDAIKSVTVTSATLATTLDDFSYVCKELGLKNAEELTVESPFDIQRNTLILTPSMPAPQSERFAPEVAKKIIEVTKRSQGRALCLFTSYRVLDAVFETVRRAVPFKLFRQGQAPRTQLIQQFREDVDSVLMGTDSFWAGVDVPGKACSVVIIDKLPFPNLSDPLQDYLKDKLGKRYFMEVSVPEALITTRQGCGRLLRTDTDRGVIVLLDSRITGKGYGRKFLHIFPEGTQVIRDIDAVGEFLKD